MYINETNKEDLRRRNRELRHKMIIKAQEIAKRKKQEIEKKQKELEKEKINKVIKHPDLVLTMLKRLRRISPWSDIVNMSPYQTALICYYKLKQMGIKDLKIAANSLHAWVEFQYDNRWWTFDPIAVKKTNLEEPIKNKLLATQIEYTTLTMYFNNIDDYLSFYEDNIDISKDEAKIIAMEDEALNTVKINYH